MVQFAFEVYTPLFNNFIMKQHKFKNLRQLKRLLLDQMSKGDHLLEQPIHLCKCLVCSKAAEKSTSKFDIAIPYNKSLTQNPSCQRCHILIVCLQLCKRLNFWKNNKSIKTPVNLIPFLKQFQNMCVLESCNFDKIINNLL